MIDIQFGLPARLVMN